MKKLLFVGHYGKTGGAGISLLRTARVAADAGFSVKICLPAGSPMAERAVSEGFDVAAYNCEPGSIEYYSGGPPLYRRTYFKKALRRSPFANEILSIANDWRPDAVILNSVTTSYLIPVFKKAGFRTGIFVRETFPKNGSMHMLKRYRSLLSGASGVYFISDYDRNLFDLKSTRTATVRNSVPDGFFEKLSKENACRNLGVLPSDKFRVLYVGGCDPIKGAEVISACSKLLPETIEIVACGAVKDELEKLFEGAACSVTCIGLCNDMRSAYGLCDVVALPIVKPHQQRPLFEAGAAGLSVIISDFPEISEYVSDGLNGMKVTPGSAKDLADAIIALSKDREALSRLSAENYRLAHENHRNAAVSGIIGKELARLTGPEVLYITNIPSPYRIEFFSGMNKAVNLTAVFERKTSKGREKAWFEGSRIDFPCIFPRGLKIGSDKALNPLINKIVADPRYTDVIINGYSSPTEMLAIKKLRKLHRPYTMWIDGGFKRDKEPACIAKTKRYYLSGAEHYLSPSSVSDEYLTYYGASGDRIIRYPFTSLSGKSDIFEKPSDESEKNASRDLFGLPKDRRIAIAVGSFIKRKGFDALIAAAKACPDLTVVICGGEPTQEYIDLVTENDIHNVRFAGFLGKEQLKKLYRACDFFVLPTREDIWGLVINEAMACGLPVITTDRCVAGLTMVENGMNGSIIASGITAAGEEPGVLERNTAEALIRYCGMPAGELYEQGVRACETAKGYTYENCVENHLTCIG